MKLAIVGAGFCGVYAAFLASKESNIEITLFDAKGIAAGASGVAAGLIHPFAGRRANKSREADQAFPLVKELIQEIAPHSILHNGIVRPCIDQQQRNDFFRCADTHPSVEWWEQDKVLDHFPFLQPIPGIFIKDGLAIDSQIYLKALIKGSHFHFVRQAIQSLDELQGFDYILLCIGPGHPLLKELMPFPHSRVKGQCLRFHYPKSLPALPYALSAKAYFVQQKEQEICTVGATFEHHYEDEEPSVEIAKQYLKQRIEEVMPYLLSQPLLSTEAAVRCTLPHRHPELRAINAHTHLLWGFGSKGLLYHVKFVQDWWQLIQS